MAQAIAGKQFPFLWEGKDRKGNRIKGRGLAKDEAELRIDLRRQGIAVAKVRKERHLLHVNLVRVVEYVVERSLSPACRDQDIGLLLVGKFRVLLRQLAERLVKTPLKQHLLFY